MNKKFLVSLALLPFGLLFHFFRRFLEFLHFDVTGRLVSILRRTDRRLSDWLDSL